MKYSAFSNWDCPALIISLCSYLFTWFIYQQSKHAQQYHQMSVSTLLHCHSRSWISILFNNFINFHNYLTIFINNLIKFYFVLFHSPSFIWSVKNFLLGKISLFKVFSFFLSCGHSILFSKLFLHFREWNNPKKPTGFSHSQRKSSGLDISKRDEKGKAMKVRNGKFFCLERRNLLDFE